MERGQSTFEFIFIIGILIFTLFLFLSVDFARNLDLIDIEEKVKLENECVKISNMISTVYSNGHGSQINVKSPYAITVHVDNRISVKPLQTLTGVPNKIGVLFSKFGESHQEFYDILSNPFNTGVPADDFYKRCPGVNGLSCSSNPADNFVDWDIIGNDHRLDDLLLILDNYQTIYLEDPHIHPKQVVNSGPNAGKTFVEVLREWISQGNVLITSKHYYCSGIGLGSDIYDSDCILVNNSENIPGDPSMVNELQPNESWPSSHYFGLSVQYNGTIKVAMIVNTQDPNLLPNGHTIDFFSFNRLEIPNKVYQEAETSPPMSFPISSVGNKFYAQSTCACFDPSGTMCIKNFNVYPNLAIRFTNATVNFDDLGLEEGNYSIHSVHCPSNEGNDYWRLHVESGPAELRINKQIDDWKVIYDGLDTNAYNSIEGVNLKSGDKLLFDCDNHESTFTDSGGNHYGDCALDYFVLTKQTPIKEHIIARYIPRDNRDKINDFKPAITNWKYNDGSFYYYSDFDVKDFSQGFPRTQTEYYYDIAETIRYVYYLNYDYTGNEAICPYYGKSKFYFVGGNITIINKNDIINVFQNG